MASKLEETELIEGLRQGREDAYRKLIDLYSDKLYRLSLRILHQEEDAREILQEVFVKVLKKIGEFQGGSSLYTWLYRVTVNESLMRRREKAGHPREESFEDLLPQYEFGFLLEPAHDWSRRADAQFETEEVRDKVKAFIAELPEAIRGAYVLKDMEDLSEDQVCEILQITKPAMKNRVHRARLILRKRIEKIYEA